MKVVMFDVDGVLANFIEGFTRLGNEMYGTPVSDALIHENWNKFPGLDGKQIGMMWSRIKADPTWWMGLQPLVTGGEIERINGWQRDAGWDVYFVTSRPGIRAKEQTENWLWAEGFERPTVICQRGKPAKGEAAKALRADYSIDDKAENAWCVSWMSDARSYLLDRPYNRYDDRIGAKDVVRVPTLEMFLDSVEAVL